MITFRGVCKFCHAEFAIRHGGTPMKIAPEFCNKEHRKAYLTETPEGIARSKGQVPDSFSEEKQARVKNASSLQKTTGSKKKKLKMDFRCPTPLKQDFRSVEDAEKFIESNHPGDDLLRPYKCPCSSIHIGHSSQSDRPEKAKTDLVFTGPREWCAYPKKSAFRNISDAKEWASTRYLPEHYDVFTCTCNYQHLRVTTAGNKYRGEQIRQIRLQG